MINTQWGYTILDVDVMPEILTVADFNAYTSNKFALDSRIASTIKSVTATVRNYCGWHIANQQRIELKLNCTDVKVSTFHGDVIIQLPFAYVANIEKVIVNAYKDNDIWLGDECEFDVTHYGCITAYDVNVDSRKSSIVIIATVGLADMDDLKGLIVNKVSAVLSGTYGIQSETTGSVSVSYNSSFVGTKSSSLMTDDKDLLLSYRISSLV